MTKSKAKALLFTYNQNDLIGGHLLEGFERGKSYSIIEHDIRAGYLVEFGDSECWLSHTIVKRYFKKVF